MLLIPRSDPLARLLTSADLRARAARVPLADAGHGHDRFGMSRAGVARALGVTRFLYERWFRVASHGIEHLPASGPAILAVNHSGTLPFDAMMLWTDVVRRTEPPRVARVVMDHFVNLLPAVGVLFTRGGGFGGSRGNMHALLEAGELVAVFPEGVRGIGKPYAERYQLQRWTEGHAEMAIRHRSPVIPVAIIGAEEQLPQIARLPIRAFGSPYLPITASPLPLPVRYHIWYGAPIPVDHLAPAQADDPDAVAALAAQSRAAVAALIERGLAEREGVFR